MVMTGTVTNSPHFESFLLLSSSSASECEWRFRQSFKDAFDIHSHGYITVILLLSTVHLPLLIKHLALSSASNHFAIQACILVLVALMCCCWQHLSEKSVSSKQ